MRKVRNDVTNEFIREGDTGSIHWTITVTMMGVAEEGGCPGDVVVNLEGTWTELSMSVMDDLDQSNPTELELEGEGAHALACQLDPGYEDAIVNHEWEASL